MKKLLRAFAVLLAAVLLLSGCSQEIPPETTAPPEYPDCPISTQRTGTQSQGIMTTSKCFECTEQGDYFASVVYENACNWLLYVDHNSDTVIKLCGRPDCMHNGKDCNASFYGMSGICYYDGYLYAEGTMGAWGTDSVIRMKPDGSEQQILFDSSAFFKKLGYTGSGSTRFANGAVYFLVNKLDENGVGISHNYYYRLDGSMKEPELLDYRVVCFDGEAVIGIAQEQATGEYIYLKADPAQGTTEELFRDDTDHTFGYIGETAEYYCEEGIVYERVYAKNEAKALFDTGLRGATYSLQCFPDCMGVIEYESYEDNGIQRMIPLALYLYDWKYNYLGSTEMNDTDAHFICGEPPGRIYVGDGPLPRYYIDKSEFGTGTLTLHPLTLPDFSQYEG